MSHAQVISDFSQFGYRELKLAAELLTAYCADKPYGLGDGVHVCMNTGSGYVFLSDEDYNVAMMNGGKLEMFYSCPECGREGFAEDIGWNDQYSTCDEHEHAEADA
jgi:hypothetical protein